MMYCWIMKWRIACSIDDDKALGARLGQHLARCPRCQHYYRVQSRTSALLSGACSDPVPVDNRVPFVHRVTGDDTIAQGRAWLPYAAALAACLVIVIGLVTAVLQTAPLAPPPEAWLTGLPQQLTPSKLSAISTGLLQNSIGSEINHISTDVREAAQFLMRCTPYGEHMKKKEARKVRS